MLCGYKPVPSTHDQHYFKGIGPNHMFRKHVSQRTNQIHDKEGVVRPERSNASNEEFLVNPLGPIEINIKNWYIIVVNETKFIVQLVKKIAST